MTTAIDKSRVPQDPGQRYRSLADFAPWRAAPVPPGTGHAAAAACFRPALAVLRAGLRRGPGVVLRIRLGIVLRAGLRRGPGVVLRARLRIRLGVVLRIRRRLMFGHNCLAGDHY
jgi:hypothetical protein